MTNSIGSATSTSASTYLTRMLARLDTDGSGSISKQEFVNGRPRGISTDQSASLFDALDSPSNGSMSLSDLSSAFQQMSSLMQATMLQTQEASDADSERGPGPGGPGGPAGPGGSGPGGGPADPAQLFSDLDADGDGTLIEDEFLAGKPDDVTTEQAEARWSELAGSNTQGLTQDQFDEAMNSNRPSGRPSVTWNSGTVMADNELQQLMTVIDSYRSSMRASTNPTLVASSRISV